MITTIGEIVSLARTELKAVKQDAFLSDRFLFAIILKHAPWLMRREDSKSKLLKFDSIVEPLDFVELIDVDKVEAGCKGVRSGVFFKRSKDKIPQLFDGYSSALFRGITSLDISEEMQMTDPTTFQNVTRSSAWKYNKAKYVWYFNEYLYFPNCEWDAVRVEGIFLDDVSAYNCKECTKCRPRQDQRFNVPGYLHAELISHVTQDIKGSFQIPSDNNQDKENIAR